ncbi:MAG TPA: hypothetical protein VLV89_03415 [Candidatus Acidoferrum sp.]|nr:hypothetical protein [Candidatus Acidoferrum sp.]
MTRLRKKTSLVVALASLAVVAAVPLLADTRGNLASATRNFRCYCLCEAKGEHHVCPMKMCDLPKYESRWWAVSCHKPAPESSTKKVQPPPPGKKRTRNFLNAQR